MMFAYRRKIQSLVVCNYQRTDTSIDLVRKSAFINA